MGADEARPVRLTRLTLTDFRNYAASNLTAEAAHVVFTGPNGAGKTNILEAISLLSPGRGLRRATYAQMGRQGTLGRWTIHARLDKGMGEIGVGIGLPPGGSARQVRVDGDDARPDDLTELLRVLWLTPAMDGLFTGSSSDRRRFLDRMALALYPDHGRRANAYERATRQRNKMFEDGVRDPHWYAAVEHEMAEHGSALTKHRAALVQTLNGAQAERAAHALDFPRSELAITGDDAPDTLAAFAERLAEGRERDRAAGRALVGPHRADLSVIHVDKGMPAALASTGEQKALLIGIVLGHAAIVGRLTKETPLLLLDEVAAHLDPSRRAALYDTLDGLGAQTFMTGTDPALFEALGARADRFVVAAGHIVAAPRG
ncbi:MAG: DNA replication/repair protein RecF [Pseudomonadota bacterium]